MTDAHPTAAIAREGRFFWAVTCNHCGYHKTATDHADAEGWALRHDEQRGQVVVTGVDGRPAGRLDEQHGTWTETP